MLNYVVRQPHGRKRIEDEGFSNLQVQAAIGTACVFDILVHRVGDHATSTSSYGSRIPILLSL